MCSSDLTCGAMDLTIGKNQPLSLVIKPQPQLQLTIMQIIAECDGNAAMRFAANKNVALSASAITA